MSSGSTGQFSSLGLVVADGEPSGTANTTRSGATLAFNDLAFALPPAEVLFFSVDSPRAFLTRPFEVILQPDGSFSVDRGAAAMLLTATVGGVPRGFRATNSTPLTGTYDEGAGGGAGLFTLSGQFEDTERLATAIVALTFTFTNRPPVARASVPGLAECTGNDRARAHFSAAASTDPDGANDLSRYLWIIDADTPNKATALGLEVDVELSLGSHTVDLVVFDRQASWGTARHIVVAADTTGPAITSIELSPSCLWPVSHKYVPFRVGANLTGVVSDTCNPNTSHLRVVDVRSNQPDDGTGDGNTVGDVRWGADGFCLRAERTGNDLAGRLYTVTVEAVDAAGNRSTTQATISSGVSHDQRGARCERLSESSFVADDDSRCVFLPSVIGGEEQTSPMPTAGRQPPRAGCSGATGPPELLGALLAALLARRRARTP